MLDSFHSEGMMEFCKLLLKRDVSDGVILGTHSFSKRTGILSGLQDLLGSSLTSTLYTSVSSRLMSVISSFVAGIDVLWFSSLLLKNAGLKDLLNILGRFL